MSFEEEVKKRLEDLEERVSNLEKMRQEGDTVEGKQKAVSVREFFISVSPQSDVQKTLVIGYYLEKHKGVSSFCVADLENAFREAREPVPGNLNDKVNKNIRKKFMMETKGGKDKKKAWVLTNAGIHNVESGFNKEV